MFTNNCQMGNIVKWAALTNIDLQILANPSQTPSKLFCEYQQTDFKLHIEKQKNQSTQ